MILSIHQHTIIFMTDNHSKLIKFTIHKLWSLKPNFYFQIIFKKKNNFGSSKRQSEGLLFVRCYFELQKLCLELKKRKIIMNILHFDISAVLQKLVWHEDTESVVVVENETFHLTLNNLPISTTVAIFDE